MSRKSSVKELLFNKLEAYKLEKSPNNSSFLEKQIKKATVESVQNSCSTFCKDSQESQ